MLVSMLKKNCKNSSLPRSYGQKTIFILFCILAYWYEKNFFRMTEILYAQRTIVSDLRKNSGSEHWICYGFGIFLIFFKILHIFFGCRRISRARNFFSTKFFFRSLEGSKKHRHPRAHQILSIFSKVETP